MGVEHGTIPDSIQMNKVGINGAKEVKDLHSKNYKTLLKKK